MTIFRVESAESRVESIGRGRGARRRTVACGSPLNGFTLVEMIVATALVMLIMLLFAEIFGAAVGTITSQKGLANNDQKARSLTATLGRDLDLRTYRAAVNRGSSLAALREFDANSSGSFDELDSLEDWNRNAAFDGISLTPRGIIALQPGERPDARQAGFFYLSENDPFDDTDDVLHFTVFLNESHRDPLANDPNQVPFQGRALNLGAGRNQPDFDDGQLGDGASSSRAAEICFFMRNGNLYRRVLLIREPAASAAPPFGTQPSGGVSGTGGPYPVFSNPYAPPTGNSFYNDWDFSGVRVYTGDTNTNGMVDPEPTDAYRFQFHGLESLDNSVGATNVPLGLPGNRFGFHRSGVPREYLLDGSGNPTAYIGRFIHEETSDPDFSYPGLEAAPGAHPLERTDLTLNGFGIVTPYAGGNRAGEDILLTHVEAFNAEVWDPGYHEDIDNDGTLDSGEDANGNGQLDSGAWVSVGNSFGLGQYTQTPATGLNLTWGNQNSGYGPIPAGGNRVFDTWHPASAAAAPFRPLQVPPFLPDGTSGPADGNPDPNPNIIYTWTAGTTAPSVGNVLFPDAAAGNFSYGYVVVGVIPVSMGTATVGARQPDWAREPGAVVRDGNIVWQCFDNRIGLERIRITVRYRDVGSDQSRQVTLIHSFVE